MGNTGTLQALLLTEETSTVARFSTICGELGIDAQSSQTASEINQRLDEQKYAAVIVDFDNPDAREQYIPMLQQSRLNKHAIVVGIATNAKNLERALQCRAHFVLKRPFQDMDIRRTLRAAYDFMLQDRRRNFRCPRILPVRLTLLQGGGTFECSTVNISSNGVAVYSSTRLKPAEAVDLEVVLPDGFVVLASGLVVWDDGMGRSGLHFQCRTPEVRKRLDSWLTIQAEALHHGDMSCREFSEMLPGNGEKKSESKADAR
jgi:PilZ domain